MTMKNINRIYFLLVTSLIFLFVSSCKNDDIILTPNTPVDPVVGDYYEGGYVFYFDKTLKVGMVCAPTDQSLGITWSNGPSYVTTGATGSAVGTGQANTAAIVTVQGAGNYAAKLCDDLVLNGYSDWFLPSIEELHLMYDTLCKKGIADLAYGVYWSSTEYSNDIAWDMLYMNGMKLYVYKNGVYDVRAVRSFKINTPPTLTTTAVSAITSNTAVSGGTITSTGSTSVTARGVCWSTSTNPTIALPTKTLDGSGVGPFTSNITGLTAATKYYVKAYATNSAGTAYGSEVSFTTLAGGATLPTLTTTSVTYSTSNSGVSGGVITTAGSSAVTARGVCWSTSTNPTVTLATKTVDGTGIGPFTSSITGIATTTKYYVRAYATTTAGTAYGNEVSFTTLAANQISDIEGNIYNTVTIGTQVWLKENLKTTKYRDGTAILNITDNTLWSTATTGAYCWYNNDIANKTTYGALYNYYSVIDTKNLCPPGWHIPSDAEWTALTTNLGGISVAGGKLKEAGTTHWKPTNTSATNSSNFTALPGGARTFVLSAFSYTGITDNGNWWSSTAFSTNNAWFLSLSYSSIGSTRSNSLKTTGLSVRCIKD